MISKLKEVWKKNTVTVLRVLLFALFVWMSYLVLEVTIALFKIFFPSFLYLMTAMFTPSLFGSKVSLDIFGFLFPLAMSVVFTVRAFKVGSYSNSRLFIYSLVILCTILVLDTMYCMFTGNQLKPIYNNGGGPNIPAILIVPIFAGIWVAMDIRKIGPLISYVFGFVVGVVSDVEGIPYLIKPTVFGGYGLLDIDFVFPIIMFLSFILAFKMSTKYVLKRSEQLV